jgi:hypothetical protein
MSRNLAVTYLAVVALAATVSANGFGTPSDRAPSERLLEERETVEPKNENRDAAPGDSPFSLIERAMRSAERGLATGDSGERTQAAQRRAIQHLDKLIELAETASRTTPHNTDQPKSNQTGTATAPAPAAGDPNELTPGGAKTGPPEPGELPMPLSRESLYDRVWGHLLPKQEQTRLQNRKPDRFLPKYELEIEQYFRRLLEEPRE